MVFGAVDVFVIDAGLPALRDALYAAATSGFVVVVAPGVAFGLPGVGLFVLLTGTFAIVFAGAPGATASFVASAFGATVAGCFAMLCSTCAT